VRREAARLRAPFEEPDPQLRFVAELHRQKRERAQEALDLRTRLDGIQSAWATSREGRRVAMADARFRRLKIVSRRLMETAANEVTVLDDWLLAVEAQRAWLERAMPPKRRCSIQPGHDFENSCDRSVAAEGDVSIVGEAEDGGAGRWTPTSAYEAGGRNAITSIEGALAQFSAYHARRDEATELEPSDETIRQARRTDPAPHSFCGKLQTKSSGEDEATNVSRGREQAQCEKSFDEDAPVDKQEQQRHDEDKDDRLLAVVSPPVASECRLRADLRQAFRLLGPRLFDKALLPYPKISEDEEPDFPGDQEAAEGDQDQDTCLNNFPNDARSPSSGQRAGEDSGKDFPDGARALWSAAAATWALWAYAGAELAELG